MDKLFTFIMITIVFTAILGLVGITSDNPTSAVSIIKDIIENGLLNSGWYSKIYLGIFVLLGAAAIYNAGTFGNASAATTIAAVAFTTYLVSLLADFVYLINYAGEICLKNATGACTEPAYYIVWVISVLIIGGYAYSAADYVLNGD